MKQEVTGSAYIKYSLYYIVIRYYDSTGKRKTLTRATDIKVRYNKKGEEIEKYRNLALSKLEALKNQYLSKIKKNDTKNIHLLSNYVDIYLENKEDWSESTHLKVHSALKNRILPNFEGKTFEEITTLDIKKFHSNLLKSGVSKNTVKHYHTYLRNLFHEAMVDEIIDKNVVSFVKIPKIDPIDKIVFNSVQIEKILNSCKNTKMEIPVILGLRYGLRLSEVLGLKWTDIDLDTGLMKIRNTVIKGGVYNKERQIKEKLIVRNNKTKTYSSKRILFLEKNLKQLLIEKREEIKENQKKFGNTYNNCWKEHIVVRDNGNLYSKISKDFTKLLQKNGIEQGSFKSLRTTFATVLFELKVDILTIKELMGHSNINTTIKYYIKYNELKKKETLEILNLYIENLNIKKEELFISDSVGSLNDINKFLSKNDDFFAD